MIEPEVLDCIWHTWVALTIHDKLFGNSIVQGPVLLQLARSSATEELKLERPVRQAIGQVAFVGSCSGTT